MSRPTRIIPKPAWIAITALAICAALAGAGLASGAVSGTHNRAPGWSALIRQAFNGSGYRQARLTAASVTDIPPGRSLYSVHPRSGGEYAFQRGATYTGTLDVTAPDVTIEAYGSGQYPVFTRSTSGNDVTLSGKYDRVSDIRLTGKGYQAVPRCGSARTAGYEIGIDIMASHDVVSSVYAYGDLYAGVYVETAGSYATISNSIFDHVDALNPPSFGSGAFGILLWGAHNTITKDVFDNQSTCSPVYGTDGSGVEIYYGSDNLIEHSTGRNDSDFTELGGSGATSNTYLDNAFSAPGGFLVTRGSGDKADGPVYKTTLIGNVAHGAVVSYDWRPGDGTLLTMKDNHVSALSHDGGYVNEGGNIIGF